MHPYTTDSHERKTIPFALAILSIFATYGLAKVIEVYDLQKTLQWVDVPAVWGFYAIFWWLFDRGVWRFRPLRVVRLVLVPDLNGEWDGRGESSHTDRQGDRQEFEVLVTIRQRWTACRVRLETRHSQSNSIIGAILVLDGERPVLSYEYRNEPRPHAEESMHGHRGMARLEVVDRDRLEGEYYTGRDRREIGALYLTRRR